MKDEKIARTAYFIDVLEVYVVYVEALPYSQCRSIETDDTTEEGWFFKNE
jgi:hypothetical protein